MPPIKKRQLLQSFEDTDICISFLFNLFETTDVIDNDDFGALLSLMMKRKLTSEEIARSIDEFYNLYHKNKPVK